MYCSAAVLVIVNRQPTTDDDVDVDKDEITKLIDTVAELKAELARAVARISKVESQLAASIDKIAELEGQLTATSAANQDASKFIYSFDDFCVQ